MCGRYVSKTDAAIERYFSYIPKNPWKEYLNFNVAPSQEAPVITLNDEERSLSMMRWGLIPSWAKDVKIGNKMINARAETVAEKPSFRAAFKQRRCLVPAIGYYEWQATKSGKIPHFIHAANGDPLAFAGLWESWASKETGESIHSYTIITTEANRYTSPIHHRMPVIVRPEDFGQWFERNSVHTQALLKPFDGELYAYPISTRVNSPGNNDEALLEPINAQL